MNLVEIYSKPNCHLCEVAKHEVLKIKQDYDFAVMEIDITQTPELFEKYKEEIPVIFVNGSFISRIQLDKDLFLNQLKMNS